MCLPNLGDMWLSKWEPLNLNHYCAQTDGSGPCGSGDVAFLLYHVISSGHIMKGACDLVNGSVSPNHHFTIFIGFIKVYKRFYKR